MKKTKSRKQHCVVDIKSGKRECFPTLDAAKRRMAALQGVKPKKAADCGCGG